MPIISFYLAEVAMSLTDAAFVGHLGTQELAAVGLSMGSLFPLLFGAVAFLSTGGVFIAESHAKGNDIGTKSALDMSLWGAVALSAPMIGVGMLLPSFFEITGQDIEVVKASAEYLSVVVWSIPSILGFSVLRTYVAALNRNRSVFVVSIVGVALNAALNYALVYGKFGLPALGLIGSAIGTVLSTFSMLLLMLIHVHRSFGYRLTLHSLRELLSSNTLALIRLGTPAFAIGLFESSLFGVVTILAGQFGVDFLAATTIAIYISDLFIVVALGLGDQLTVEVAGKASSADYDACRQLTRAGLLITTACCIPLATLCVLAPDLLVGLFIDQDANDSAAVILASRGPLAVLAVFLFADSCQIILSRALKGMRDTLVPMWIAAIGYWIVGIGSGWFLATSTELGGIALWYGLAAGLSLAAIAMGIRFGQICAVRERSLPAVSTH